MEPEINAFGDIGLRTLATSTDEDDIPQEDLESLGSKPPSNQRSADEAASQQSGRFYRLDLICNFKRQVL